MLAIAVLVFGCQPAEESKPPAEDAVATETEAPVDDTAEQPPTKPVAQPPVAEEPEPEPALTPEPRPAKQPEPTTSGETEPAMESEGTEPALLPSAEPTDVVEMEKPVDLGPPLVDNADQLQKLDPEKPVWLDRQNKQVVVQGQVCARDVPLELFACLKDTKEHEAVITCDAKAITIHAGLLASGAVAGNPVKFAPKYEPATGTEIEVSVAYKDPSGKVITVPAQQWIIDNKTNKPMTAPWVFGGSYFWVDETTGEKIYQAEGGDFICVSNFSTAMLDLPISSSSANDALLFKANTPEIPALGTPVTLILKPKVNLTMGDQQ